MNTVPDPEQSLTLEILDSVQRNEQISQRHLSRQLGVALGLDTCNVGQQITVSVTNISLGSATFSAAMERCAMCGCSWSVGGRPP